MFVLFFVESLVARLSGSIFYANGLISLILTWRFIGSWDDLSQHWLRNELSSGLNIASDKYIKRNVIIITIFVSVCAIGKYGKILIRKYSIQVNDYFFSS